MKKNKKDDCNVDAVIVWVDDSDIEWRREKIKYEVTNQQDTRECRFRDWGTLRYLFRGLEKFAPWINHIFFVTCGQIPTWLNKDNPKLKLVNHSEFMDSRTLPTFNSSAIISSLHKIEALSEYFILFNDDCFLTRKTQKKDFFINNMPVDMFMEYPIGCTKENEIMTHIQLNNYNIMAKYYTRKMIKKRLKSKIINWHYGGYFFYNLIVFFIPYPHFFGLLTPHFPQAYLKSCCIELWELEKERFEENEYHRFRDRRDVTEYSFRMWNLLKGNFVPRNRLKNGKFFKAGVQNKKIYKAIISQKYKMICINDEEKEDEFESTKNKICNAFEKILPEKGMFEK